MDHTIGRIFPLVQQYFQQQMFEKIPRRSKPGVTYCCYTDYESDHMGGYIYFIGEEVPDFDNVPPGFATLEIPAQEYVKFTAGPDKMPDVLKNAWGKIWNMDAKTLGGKRRYLADFELYDERAANHDKVVLDIYVGIEKMG